MKIVRVQLPEEVTYAVLKNEKVYPMVGLPYQNIELDGREFDVEDAKLLAPCEPGKVVAVGLNYLDHIKEMNDPMPDEPVIFLKPSTAVIGPGDAIIWPRRSEKVSYEAELACVIKKTCKKVSYDEANDYILGYTCCNDITARDLQPIDGQWTRAKGFDTFCPLGPVIETELDPDHLPIQSFLNGQIRQDGNTEQMMRNVRYLVSFISSVMTLQPGDVITTGTPMGVGGMQEGDTIEIRIGGIGSLINTVEKEA